MTPEDVKKHFKNGYWFKKATGMSHSCIHNWIKWGYVPRKSQEFLDDFTGGILKCGWVNLDNEEEKNE